MKVNYVLKRCLINLIIVSILLVTVPGGIVTSYAIEVPDKTDQEHFFRAVEAVTNVPWHIIAAVYQYETNIHKRINGNPQFISHLTLWGGIGNVEAGDRIPYINQLNGGIGLDGNGDGISDKENFYDVIYSLACWISTQGNTKYEYIQSLKQLYSQEKAIQRIEQFTKIYQHYDTVEITGNAFPIPLNHSYSYRSTWGAGRSFGGYRIHEGTDIFARAWTPVKSTSHGIVEIKGWNKYGGWRVGVRDLNNVYHYYAHLAGFSKGLKEGDIVEAGQVIGYVGNSGYGKQGTTGKFPPHLHYGMYKDTGKHEWAFDPTPSLHRWERADKQKRR